MTKLERIYQSATDFAQSLRRRGYPEWASQIEKSMYGFGSGEVLGDLEAILQEIKVESDVPSDREMSKAILKSIRRALFWG